MRQLWKEMGIVSAKTAESRILRDDAVNKQSTGLISDARASTL